MIIICSWWCRCAIAKRAQKILSIFLFYSPALTVSIQASSTFDFFGQLHEKNIPWIIGTWGLRQRGRMQWRSISHPHWIEAHCTWTEKNRISCLPESEISFSIHSLREFGSMFAWSVSTRTVANRAPGIICLSVQICPSLDLVIPRGLCGEVLVIPLWNIAYNDLERIVFYARKRSCGLIWAF